MTWYEWVLLFAAVFVAVAAILFISMELSRDEPDDHSHGGCE